MEIYLLKTCHAEEETMILLQIKFLMSYSEHGDINRPARSYNSRHEVKNNVLQIINKIEL